MTRLSTAMLIWVDAEMVREDFDNIPSFSHLRLSLHASANDVDTQVTEGSQVLFGSGLVIAGNKCLKSDEGSGGGDTTSSVLLTANKFRSRIPNLPQILQGTVRISNVERCALTGNLILNKSEGEQTQNQFGDSGNIGNLNYRQCISRSPSTKRTSTVARSFQFWNGRSTHEYLGISQYGHLLSLVLYPAPTPVKVNICSVQRI